MECNNGFTRILAEHNDRREWLAITAGIYPDFAKTWCQCIITKVPFNLHVNNELKQ
jgi:hypothetical protein